MRTLHIDVGDVEYAVPYEVEEFALERDTGYAGGHMVTFPEGIPAGSSFREMEEAAWEDYREHPGQSERDPDEASEVW